MPEARRAQKEPHQRHDRGEHDHADRHRTDTTVTQEPELARHLARCTLEVGVQRPPHDERRPQGRNKGVDAQLGDNEAVYQPDPRPDRQHGTDAERDGGRIATHRGRRDDGRHTYEVGDGEVERAADYDERLPGGYDAQGDGAHEHVADVRA